MQASELLIPFVRSHVKFVLASITIHFITAMVRADEANLSFGEVNSLHMESERTLPGEGCVRAKQALEFLLSFHAEMVRRNLIRCVEIY